MPTPCASVAPVSISWGEVGFRPSLTEEQAATCDGGGSVIISCSASVSILPVLCDVNVAWTRTVARTIDACVTYPPEILNYTGTVYAVVGQEISIAVGGVGVYSGVVQVSVEPPFYLLVDGTPMPMWASDMVSGEVVERKRVRVMHEDCAEEDTPVDPACPAENVPPPDPEPDPGEEPPAEPPTTDTGGIDMNTVSIIPTAQVLPYGWCPVDYQTWLEDWAAHLRLQLPVGSVNFLMQAETPAVEYQTGNWVWIEVNGAGRIKAFRTYSGGEWVESIQRTGYLVDAGTASAWVVSTPEGATALADIAGSTWWVKVLHATTGATTVTFDSCTATAVLKEGDQPIEAGDVKAGQIVMLTTDGTTVHLVNTIPDTLSVPRSWTSPEYTIPSQATSMQLPHSLGVRPNKLPELIFVCQEAVDGYSEDAEIDAQSVIADTSGANTVEGAGFTIRIQGDTNVVVAANHAEASLQYIAAGGGAATFNRDKWKMKFRVEVWP